MSLGDWHASLDNWLAESGATLGFTAHEPRLHVEQRHDGPGSRTISMQLKLERREDVRLPDERSLKEVRWNMLLRERVYGVGVPEKEEPIGILSYLEEGSGDYDVSPEGCHIEAVINREIFSALLCAIQAGRLPDRVSVTVRGLKYGSDRDGREKIWNVKALENAPVTNLTFGILMIASNTESSTDSSSSESIGHLPASSADIQTLHIHITDQIALLTRTVWQALACLVGAALLLWIFRH
ncbi:MAG: hypothetical protein ACREAS_06700 [Nitrososphaera sp.]